MAAPARRPRRGAVTEYDPVRGLGTVTDDAGVQWGFHCTAIADGSRTIEVGTRVAFEVVPGHLGRMEAAGVAALGE